MPKGKTNRKIDRFAVLTETVANLITIGSWVATTITALILKAQKTPVAIPGFNATLDADFQFALLISGVLSYIHYLQYYWKKNHEEQELSPRFVDFLFGDLPRGKRPLLLIPFVLVTPLFCQISTASFFNSTIMMLIVFGLVLFMFFRLMIWAKQFDDLHREREQELDDDEERY